ncbi:hypothetical protein JTE90_014142 [Oedothorax gibbosus]|uniref:Vacuolar ATPase assembly protein VMA22 n=1 Tax=Oedothorax gibbosus TaxID=931172 RepID=A0AAV6VKA1_9ARAC|nr:hypothetical protein JTE90_014142 [Oedothorax gibbosus]
MSKNSENLDLKSVKKDLDNISIAILDTLQNIVLEKQYLDANLKEGYINMAKSRYLMRGQKISTLQINTSKLVPSYKVVTNSDLVEGVEYLNYQSLELSVQKGSGSSVKRRSTEELVDLSEKLEKTSIDSNSDDSQSSKECAGPTDPLKWFGVLVPESLRLCQSRFKQATETALKIASLQNQLKALGNEYKELKLQKQKLVNDG